MVVLTKPALQLACRNYCQNHPSSAACPTWGQSLAALSHSRLQMDLTTIAWDFTLACHFSHQYGSHSTLLGCQHTDCARASGSLASWCQTQVDGSMICRVQAWSLLEAPSHFRACLGRTRGSHRRSSGQPVAFSPLRFSRIRPVIFYRSLRVVFSLTLGFISLYL